AMDSTSLLRTADEALYAAKHLGRNRVLPAQKKYMCESQPAMPAPKPITRPEPPPPPFTDPNLPQLPENARFDQTIISQRIYIPDEEP
ncbi:MAG TPA: hypothetical protein VJB88_13710, partial [Vicinamibacteria bacterium]|nr:hypothetical protein [Vicinamibacteria bacterium]